MLTATFSITLPTTQDALDTSTFVGQLSDEEQYYRSHASKTFSNWSVRGKQSSTYLSERVQRFDQRAKVLNIDAADERIPGWLNFGHEIQLDAQGRMVTTSGFPLAAGITIPAEAQSVTIGTDGVVSVKMPGQATPQQVGAIELANFVNPAGLEPRGQNVFSESLASGNPITGAPGTAGMGTVMQGFVETSNVNVVQELVTMIQTQRAYEMNSKAVSTSASSATSHAMASAMAIAVTTITRRTIGSGES